MNPALAADWSTDPAVWSYGIAALVFGAFSTQLILGRRGSGVGGLLLAAVILQAAWAAATLAHAAIGGALAWTVARAFDGLRYAALLAFLAMIRVQGFGGAGSAAGVGRSQRLLTGGLLVAVIVVHVFAPLPMAPAARGGMDMLVPVLLLGTSVVGLVLVEQVYRNMSQAQRWNVRPLCVALAAVFGYDLVLYSDAALFREVDANLWAARGVAHALVTPLLGIAAARNKDWRFDVALSRGVVAGSTALVASGVYLLAIAIIGYYVHYFGGSWGRALLTVVLFAGLVGFVLVTLSGTFRAKMRVFVAKHFFPYRYDYREEWLSFTRTLSNPGTPGSIRERGIRALADLVESIGGALWMKGDDGSYGQVARVNLPASDHVEAASDWLPSFLAETGWVIDLHDLRRDPAKYKVDRMPSWLLQFPAAWLVVPLFDGEELLGFVLLAEPRVRFELNWEVLDLLKTAGRQVAGFLAQERATEALLEARKFDAFNRMSAFVVHDLKNLVAQLQLLLRNAERHRANPDFQRDMLATVEHAVGRMNHLMRQLRSGVEPVERPGPVELRAVADRLQQRFGAIGQGLSFDLEPGIVVVGHEDRVERVVGHLVQNAIDASGDNPRVSVRIRRDGAQAVIEVADHGTGMTAEFVRERLFKPFQSTKHTGMGIGAYESQQYVSSIGGRIEVDTAPGAGTTVRVFLPLASRSVVEAEGAA
ncbi:MAG: XrtA/PEP-CTERM system histidine kinase PrsK [Burkholderiaceae bacterium]